MPVSSWCAVQQFLNSRHSSVEHPSFLLHNVIYSSTLSGQQIPFSTNHEHHRKFQPFSSVKLHHWNAFVPRLCSRVAVALSHQWHIIQKLTHLRKPSRYRLSSSMLSIYSGVLFSRPVDNVCFSCSLHGKYVVCTLCYQEFWSPAHRSCSVYHSSSSRHPLMSLRTQARSCENLYAACEVDCEMPPISWCPPFSTQSIIIRVHQLASFWRPWSVHVPWSTNSVLQIFQCSTAFLDQFLLPAYSAYFRKPYLHLHLQSHWCSSQFPSLLVFQKFPPQKAVSMVSFAA